MRRRINRVKGILAGKGGFTLLELIVVIAIMGFLVAAVAPRFAGIAGGTVDTVCDTNQQRLVTAIGAFTEKEHELPDNLISIATGSIDTQGGVLLHENSEPQQGLLTEDLVDRNNLSHHVLNEDEADKLREMGITKVRNIKGDFVSVASGTVVAIVGDGAASPDATDITLVTGGTFGEIDHLYRIVLGIGPKSELARKGYVSEAGLCPGGLQKEEVFNHYLLVVPRMEATLARIDGVVDTESKNKVIVEAVGLCEDDRTTGHTFTFELKAEEMWNFSTQCPEGHKWPADVNEVWRITTAASIATY